MKSQQVVERLQQKYPQHEFVLLSKRDIGQDNNEAMSDGVITFCHAASSTTTWDPFTSPCGRFDVSPKDVYGIEIEDACLIAALNEPSTRHEVIGTLFASILAEAIGVEKYAEVRRRNKLERDPQVCHSHDFCDANVYMQEAMETCGETVFNAQGHIDDSTCELWNKAWDFAKAKHLTATRRKAA